MIIDETTDGHHPALHASAHHGATSPLFPQVPNGLMGIMPPMATADEDDLATPESTNPDAPAAKAMEEAPAEAPAEALAAAPGAAAPAAAPGAAPGAEAAALIAAAAGAPPKRGRLKSRDEISDAAREQGKGKGPLAEQKKKKRAPLKGNFGATFKFTPRGSPVDTGEKKRFVDCR